MPPSGRLREKGSPASGAAITLSAVIAPATVSEKTETQSSVRQAGTTPAVEIRPRLGPRPPQPGTRSTRYELAADGMDGNAIGGGAADNPRRELVEIGLADDDGAG